ncbi:MAG: substrate-binding domain-containing protein [Spirochaetia bacterium]|jgi:ribose transport system substrate-binding protein
MRKAVMLVLVALFAMAIIMGGWAQQKKSLFQGSPNEVYYFVDFLSTSGEYWPSVYEGFKLCAAQLGVETAYAGTTEYDVNKEVAAFNQVVAKNPAGIALCPMIPDPFVDPINKAMDKGIPVMTWATDSPASKRFAFITSDNVKEGYAAADAVAKAIGGEGEVFCTENPGQLNHEIRVKSFKERIEKNWPKVKVVATIPTNIDMNKAFTGTKTLLQAHPNIRGEFSPETQSALGCAQAAQESGVDLKVFSCDVTEATLDMIMKGQLLGVIEPNVVVQGYMSMLYLYLAKHQLVDPINGWKETGKPFGFSLPFADNGLDVVTKENAKYFYLKEYMKSRNVKGINESAQQMKRPSLQN